MSNNYYVYGLFRPWNGIICYIGKGKGKRWQMHAYYGEHHSNKYLANIFKKAKGELPIIIIRENLTEDKAFETEITLIKAIGRKNLGTGPLANLTDGGEGPSGRVVSEETRKLIKNLWRTPAYRDKILKSLQIGNATQIARERKSISNKNSPKVKSVLDKLHSDPILRLELSRRLTLLMSNPIEKENRVKGMHTIESRIKGSKSRKINAKPSPLKGRIWINDGEQHRLLIKTEPIPIGWKIGRMTPWVTTESAKRLNTIEAKNKSHGHVFHSNCLECGILISAPYPTKKWCSSKCSMKSYTRRKREKQIPPPPS